MPEDCVVFSSLKTDDEEFKRIMKNARRKLEILMPAAMPCKTPTDCSGETCRSNTRPNMFVLSKLTSL